MSITSHHVRSAALLLPAWQLPHPLLSFAQSSSVSAAVSIEVPFACLGPRCTFASAVLSLSGVGVDALRSRLRLN